MTDSSGGRAAYLEVWTDTVAVQSSTDQAFPQLSPGASLCRPEIFVAFGAHKQGTIPTYLRLMTKTIPEENNMADRIGLRIIGLAFSAITAAVLLAAATTVSTYGG